MESGYSRWRFNMAAVVVAAALGACAPAPQPGPAPGPGPGPGILTGVALPAGPLDQLPRATLRGLSNQVTWEGCVWAARTSTTSTPTVIQICAAAYAKRLGEQNTANTGVLTARMINLGTSPDARWQLTPRDTSYIISFPNMAAAGRYAILEVPANTAPGSRVRVVNLAPGQIYGTFVYCPHTGPEPPNSSGSFYTCDQKLQIHGRNPTSDVRGPNAADEDLLLPDMNGPAWVSCLSGCCTTDAQ